MFNQNVICCTHIDGISYVSWSVCNDLVYNWLLLQIHRKLLIIISSRIYHHLKWYLWYVHSFFSEIFFPARGTRNIDIFLTYWTSLGKWKHIQQLTLKIIDKHFEFFQVANFTQYVMNFVTEYIMVYFASQMLLLFGERKEGGLPIKFFFTIIILVPFPPFLSIYNDSVYNWLQHWYHQIRSSLLLSSSSSIRSPPSSSSPSSPWFII